MKKKKTRQRVLNFPRREEKGGKENGNFMTLAMMIPTYYLFNYRSIFEHSSIVFPFLNLLLPRGAEGMRR